MPPPGTIRFLPPRSDQHPAIVTAYGIPSEFEPDALKIAEDAIAAVHLTLIRPDGTGKADTEPNKITVGSPAGNPLVLAPMNDLMGLAICEGIEDALSVHLATGLGAWAAGSASYLPALVTAVEAAKPDCVTFFVDDDDTGRSNMRKLATALADPDKYPFEILIREAS